MNVHRAISGLLHPRLRRAATIAVLSASVVIGLLMAVMVTLSIAQGTVRPSTEVWRAHHEACHRIPEEAYHRDRFRAVEGRVSDENGQPVAGALVRSARLESLVELARGGSPSPSRWNVPIETETRTDEHGRYEFPHLPVGGRTFFYSAPAGRDLAPAIKDLIVVQDGLGAQLDVTLGKPAKLTVRFPIPMKEATRLYLVPERWWPDLTSATVPATWRATGFPGLGGPFRRGLIAVGAADLSVPLKIIGRYDLDRSLEVDLPGLSEKPVWRFDLPEAAGIEPWRFEPSSEERQFYAAMSPIPLFWPESPTGWPSWLAVPGVLTRWHANQLKSRSLTKRDTLQPGKSANRKGGGLPGRVLPNRGIEGPFQKREIDAPAKPATPQAVATAGSAGALPFRNHPSETDAESKYAVPPAKATRASSRATGTARGFALHPFLPVLLESHTAAPRLGWSSEASEFEFVDLPIGFYRVRALDLFGRATFAAGVAVRPGMSEEKHVRLGNRIDLDEPESRQVIGFVRWESGAPVAKAVVFMQCSYDFRRYVRRVESDEQGFFYFSEIPEDEPYFVFAVPPNDSNAMRDLTYFGVGSLQREAWKELTLHPHRLAGTIRTLPTSPAPGPPNVTGIPSPDANAVLQLIRVESGSEQVVWTFRTEPAGQFVVSNVPHGRYRVQGVPADDRPIAHSFPIDIADGRHEYPVQWSP